MTYPINTTYSSENQWDRNTHVDAEGTGRRNVNQVNDLEDADLNLKGNRYTEESEGVNNAVAHRAIGPSRRRPFQNPEVRMQTAQTRKDKACLRCRMQKIRVLNPNLQPYYKLLTATLVLSGPFRSNGNLFDL